jgi:hypothetical protein
MMTIFKNMQKYLVHDTNNNTADPRKYSLEGPHYMYAELFARKN